jgi:phosphonate transport system substrate-binding protein
MKHVSFLSLIILLLFISPLYADHAHEYQFGVFPYLPPQRIDPLWSPLAKHLTEELHRGVEVRTRSEYSQFRNAISEEVFDIAFVQPFAYTEMAYFHNYIPLVRGVSKFDIHHKGKLAGVFVVLAESPISKLTDITDGIIAMPPKIAAVSQLGVATLIENGMTADSNISISHQRNHIACMQQLVIKKAITCVAATPPMIQFEKKTGLKLRIIATTRKIPSSLIVIHKRIPASEREFILKKLLELEKNKIGRDFLNEAGLSRFIVTTDADYNEVRSVQKKLGHKKNK